MKEYFEWSFQSCVKWDCGGGFRLNLVNRVLARISVCEPTYFVGVPPSTIKVVANPLSSLNGAGVKIPEGISKCLKSALEQFERLLPLPGQFLDRRYQNLG